MKTNSPVSILWLHYIPLCKEFSFPNYTSSRHYKLIYIADGYFDIEFDDGKPLRPETGDLVFIKEKENNRFINSNAIIVEFRFILWDDELKSLLNALPHTFRADPIAKKLIDTLVSSTRSSNKISPQTLNLGFGYLLHHLVDLQPLSAFESTASFAKIKNYVDEHFTEKISLDDIAAHSGYTKPYMCRLFKQACGITILEYINRQRIREACKYLSYSDLPTDEIYVRCGFADLGTFMRNFKKLVGIPPNRYRRSHEPKGIIFNKDAEEFISKSAPPPYFTIAADANRMVVWDSFDDYIFQRRSDLTTADIKGGSGKVLISSVDGDS